MNGVMCTNLAIVLGPHSAVDLGCVSRTKTKLVGGLEHCLFFHIVRIIIPIDYHIFQRGRLKPPSRKPGRRQLRLSGLPRQQLPPRLAALQGGGWWVLPGGPRAQVDLLKPVGLGNHGEYGHIHDTCHVENV